MGSRKGIHDIAIISFISLTMIKMLHFLNEAVVDPNYYGVHRDHHRTLATAVEKLGHLRSGRNVF